MKTPHYRWLTAAPLLALSIGIASAQAPDQAPNGPPPAGQSDARPHRGGPDRELQTLTRVLTLTPDQQTGVKAVLEQQSTQMRALRSGAQSGAAANDTPEARQARFQQMEQIRDESNTKITALLDDNQKKLFADWTAQHKAGMGRQRRGDGPPPPDGAAPPPPSQQ